jgi:UDP-glucose 4-epimerase
MAKYLVTGGCGFIGSHLVESLLNQGQEVIVLDNLSTGRRVNLSHIINNEKLKIVEGDLQDKDLVKKSIKDCNYVFHLAALADIVPSIVNPLSYFSSNVLGTVTLLEAARNAGIKKLVYSASSSCYGIPDFYPTDETSRISPQYPYAFTKWAGEQAALHWGQVYKIPVISLRLFNVYGPRSRTSGTYGAVFGVFLAQKLNEAPLTIVGDGSQTRDFTYVTDVAEAFIAAAKSEYENAVFNVGSGNTYSVNYLAQLLGGKTVHIPKRPGEPDCTFADIEKIQKLLGWKPKVSFEEGIKTMLANINYWKDAPVWNPESIDNATKEWFSLLGNSNVYRN